MRKIVGVVFLWLLLSSWGYEGHNKITIGSKGALNPLMMQFQPWIETIGLHSSDADKRKSWDQEESNKHYIDIDNYETFNTTGRINQNLDSLIVLNGNSFVQKQGILPWATMATIEKLTEAFANRNFDDAILLAADLSHYVGDGHMPLHITSNYNGQETGNEGIHYRYESLMISTYLDQIRFDTETVKYIDNVSEYIFNYIYKNHAYINEILEADNQARLISADTKSDEYIASLWEQTKDLTIRQFNGAAQVFGNLFYTAWVEAGMPNIDNTAISNEISDLKFEIEVAYVNVADSFVNIIYETDVEDQILFELVDLKGGSYFKTKYLKKPGKYEGNFFINDLPNGIYILNMRSRNKKASKRIVIGEN